MTAVAKRPSTVIRAEIAKIESAISDVLCGIAEQDKALKLGLDDLNRASLFVKLENIYGGIASVTIDIIGKTPLKPVALALDVAQKILESIKHAKFEEASGLMRVLGLRASADFTEAYEHAMKAHAAAVRGDVNLANSLYESAVLALISGGDTIRELISDVAETAARMQGSGGPAAGARGVMAPGVSAAADVAGRVLEVNRLLDKFGKQEQELLGDAMGARAVSMKVLRRLQKRKAELQGELAGR